MVTVLCGGLAEATDWEERLGAEAMHHLMQTLLARVQNIVQRYDGTLVQVSGEEFVGLFGAPVAHEDHARRAVLAAVELRRCSRAKVGMGESLRSAFSRCSAWRRLASETSIPANCRRHR